MTQDDKYREYARQAQEQLERASSDSDKAAWLWIAQQAPHYFLPKSALDLDTWPAALGVAIWIALIGSAVVAQVYRYRRVSGGVAREQARWIGFGVSKLSR